MIKKLLAFLGFWECYQCGDTYTPRSPKHEKDILIHGYIVEEDGFLVRPVKTVQICEYCAQQNEYQSLD